MYTKDFNSWNTEKQCINKVSKNLFFYEREIWWCILGVNIGVEIDGKNNRFQRPVIILKCINKDMLLVIPLTSKNSDTKYHFPIVTKRVNSFAKISQIRVISSKRLFRKMDTLDESSFILLKRATIGTLF